MSGVQRAVLTMGLAVFVLMGLFPPWVCKYSESGYEPGGYAFIGVGPSNPNVPPSARTVYIDDRPVLPRETWWRATRMDTARLATQWLTVMAVVGTVLVLLHKGRPRSSPAP